jgi:hypothetical protein
MGLIKMFKLLGKGELLAQIGASISDAESSIWVVGPWLDAYFMRKITDSLTHPDLPLKFIVRMDKGLVNGKTLSALNLARQHLANFQARALENLHSKILVVDDEIFFLGSANWYWYSLKVSVEATIQGNTIHLPELLPEIERYWEQAAVIPTEEIKKNKDFEPLKVLYRN